jgi:hypothetical protein
MSIATNERKSILKELRKMRKDIDFIKMVISQSDIGDLFLTKEDEKAIEETLEQKKKGELLDMEEVFGE